MAFIGIKINPHVSKILNKIDIPGEKEDTSQFHITLLCFEDNFPIEEISKAIEASYDVISKIKPFTIEIDEICCFPKRSDNPCPIIATIESKDLQEIHDKLAKEFDKYKVDYSKVHKDYKPHITLSYSDEEIEKFKIDKIEFEVYEIVLWGGDNGEDRVFITFPLENIDKTSKLFHKINSFYTLSQLK